MAILRRAAEQHGIEFTLLSDPQSDRIRAFGVYNEKGEGIPHPTIFLIDQEGPIRGKLRFDGFRKRPTSGDIINAVRNLNAAE